MLDADAPEAWIASGNLFSVRGDHITALRHLQHAVRADASRAYTWTLAGHEHLACGLMERAVDCFRAAIARSPRHYNAWFGLVGCQASHN